MKKAASAVLEAPKKRGNYNRRKIKRDYVPVSDELHTKFERAIRKSDLNLNNVVRKYFLGVCTPQTLQNILSRSSKKTTRNTHKQITEFCDKYGQADTAEENNNEALVTSMVYQTVSPVELMEKLIVVRNIVNSDLDKETKLAVIQNAVKIC